MSKQALFEVGDKVRAPHFNGVLEVTAVREVDAYPVVVRDRAANALLRYTAYGKAALSDSEPSLRHAATGSPCVVGEPPKRFKYPLYFINDENLVVKFDGLRSGVVVAREEPDFPVGYSSDDWILHINKETWTPCEKPVWKPTKPTWCWVWDDHTQVRRRLMVVPHNDPDKFFAIAGGGNILFDNAEPCKAEDIPDYWPESWK